MEITLSIKGQELKILGKQPNLYNGSIGVLYIKFCDVNFDTTLVKTVRFKTEESDWYTADVVDGRVRVPHEVIVVGGFDVAVGGYETEDGELLRFLPTNSVHIDVMENGYGEPDAPLFVEGESESIIGQLAAKADLDLVQKLVSKNTVEAQNVIILDHIRSVDVINYSIFGRTADIGDLVEDINSKYIGKYRIPIKISGKNLFDVNMLRETEFLSVVDSSVLIKDGAYSNDTINFFVDLKPNRKYKCVYKLTCDKKSESAQGGIALRTNDGKHALHMYNDWNIRVYDETLIANTFMTPANIEEYTRFTLYGALNGSGKTVFKDIMIFEDEWDDLTYEPFYSDERNIYISEPLHIGEYIDSQLKKVVFNDHVEQILLPRIPIPNTSVVRICVNSEGDGVIRIQYYQDINKVIAELKAAHSA